MAAKRGRPRKENPEDRLTEQVCVGMTARDKARVMQMAKSLGCSPGEVMRRRVDQVLPVGSVARLADDGETIAEYHRRIGSHRGDDGWWPSHEITMAASQRIDPPMPVAVRYCIEDAGGDLEWADEDVPITCIGDGHQWGEWYTSPRHRDGQKYRTEYRNCRDCLTGREQRAVEDATGRVAASWEDA